MQYAMITKFVIQNMAHKPAASTLPESIFRNAKYLTQTQSIRICFFVEIPR